MGAGASRRYKYGIRPSRYFERHVLPTVQPLLQSLEISPPQAFELFQAFVKIDVDRSGDIGLREYQRFLGVKKTTAFTERVFGCPFDDGRGSGNDGGGGGGEETNNLSYDDFLKGVWRFCTYDAILMSMFFFNIFDVDRQGKLQIEECDALLRMAHDSKTADPTLMTLVERRCRCRDDDDNNGEGKKNDDDDLTITAESFAALVDDEPRILRPAFELRDKMREALLGLDYWERATKRRLERFGSVDSLDEIMSLAAAAASETKDIAMMSSSSSDDDDDDGNDEKEDEEDADLSLPKTQSARLVIPNDEKIRNSDENDDNIDVVAVPSSETKGKQRTEIDDRHKNIMELPDERRERKLRKKLTTTHDQLLQSQHYTLDNVHDRTHLRTKLWKLFDETKSSSYDALAAQKRKELDELEHYSLPQRKEQLTTYLETEEGKRRLARDVADVRARLIVEAWAGGNVVQRFFNRLIVRKGRERRRRRRRSDGNGDDTDYESDDDEEEEEDDDEETMEKKEDDEQQPRPVLSSWAVPLVSRLNSRVNDRARDECVKAIERSFLQDEINAIEDKYRERTSSLSLSWKKYNDDLVKTFGPPQTHWEKLVRIVGRDRDDDDNNDDGAATETTRYFWYNTTTAEKIERQRDPAICESCDAFIDCVDYKCFSCGELRSDINRERYKGRIPLNDIEEIRRQQRRPTRAD